MPACRTEAMAVTGGGVDVVVQAGPHGDTSQFSRAVEVPGLNARQRRAHRRRGAVRDRGDACRRQHRLPSAGLRTWMTSKWACTSVSLIVTPVPRSTVGHHTLEPPGDDVRGHLFKPSRRIFPLAVSGGHSGARAVPARLAVIKATDKDAGRTGVYPTVSHDGLLESNDRGERTAISVEVYPVSIWRDFEAATVVGIDSVGNAALAAR